MGGLPRRPCDLATAREFLPPGSFPLHLCAKRVYLGAVNLVISCSLGNFSCHKQAQPEPQFYGHVSTYTHPKTLGSRRGGQASARGCRGHLHQRSARDAQPRGAGVRQGRSPAPGAARPEPSGPSPVNSRGAEVPRGGRPGQVCARGAAQTRASDSGPRDPAPQPRRQPEAAAIYRGSHAQSLLAAAATAEYFAQIWLGPRRGGREPREREGYPGRVGGLPGRRSAGVGAGAGGRQTGAGGGRASERSAGLDELPFGRGRAGAVGSEGGSQGRAPLRAVTAPRPARRPLLPYLSLHSGAPGCSARSLAAERPPRWTAPGRGRTSLKLGSADK